MTCRTSAQLLSSWVVVTLLGCGEPASARPVSGEELSDALGLETGVAVFANAFSCGISGYEFRRLEEWRSKGVPVKVVLLAEPGDSAAATLAARDMGLRQHRIMTPSRFVSLRGQGGPSTLPLFVLFKRGQPVLVMGDVVGRRLEALEALF